MKISNDLQSRKKVIIDFLTYSFGTIFLKGAGFILIPLYTRVFTPEEYGRLVLVLFFIGGTSLLLGMGLQSYLPVEYFHYEGKERHERIARMFSFYIHIALPLTVLLLCITPLINRYIFDSTVTPGLLTIALLLSFLTFFSEQYFALLKYQLRARRLVAIQMIVGLLELLLSILFVVNLGMGIWGIVAARAARVTIPVILAAMLEKVNIWHSWQFLGWKDIVVYTKIVFPLLILSISVWIVDAADRWILEYLSTTKVVGLYSLAYSIGQLFEILILLPIHAAYAPFLYTNYQSRGLSATERFNSWVVLIYMAGAMITVFLLYTYGRPVFNFFIDEEFHDAYPYIFPVITGYIFLGASYMLSPSLFFSQKFKWNMSIFVVAAMFNIVANLLVIPIYGVWGAAITTSTSYLLVAGLVLIARNRVVKESFSTLRATV